MNISVDIPQDILDSARLTVPDFKREVAVHLYAEGRLSVGKARELAGMTLWEFRQLLASRRIPVHFGVDDLRDDMAALQPTMPEPMMTTRA